MKTITTTQVIGSIVAGSVARKDIKGKALTEFYIEDCGLRISAWEDRAAQVPDAGIVIVNGYLSTREYEYEGKQRTSTDIRATSIQVIDTAPADLSF